MEKFFQKMKSLLGDEFNDFVSGFESPPFRAIRLNTLKAERAVLEKNLPFELKAVPFCADGFYIPSEFEGIGANPLHCAGAFYVQEPSAMSAVTMLAPQKGDFVLDLCAAPGGKSTQIAAALQCEGLLWANEVIRSRANILLSNIERLGVRNSVVSSCHPQTLCERLSGFFDKILVDAPCSGEGMFRKDKNAAREWSQEHVLACAKRQLQILESARLALKSGGVIVYSTCTFSEEENEGVITEFLRRNPDFVLESSGGDFGRTTLGCAKRIFPTDGGEGHFAARLRHTGEAVPAGSMLKTSCKKVSEAVWQMYDTVFKNRPFGENLTLAGTKVLALPDGLPALDGLGVIRAGVMLAELLKNRVEPAHGAFMAARPADCTNVADFDCNDDRLRRFLHGEEIAVDSALKGFTAVCADGVVTGFGKASGGILKNKYPKGLRIN